MTEVIVVPGRKKRKTTPVCAEHAERFEREGQMTTRLEQKIHGASQQRSRQWKRQQRWR